VTSPAGGPPSGRPFQLLESRPDPGTREAVPVYDLSVAAGAFGSSQSPEEIAWALVKTRRALDASMFVARVVGQSMEAGVPDGSYVLFRRFDAGAAPSATALDGRRVVVELREGAQSDLGGRYTLKRWRVVAMDSEGAVSEIELRPDNRAYKGIRMRQSDGEIRVVAELLDVLT
jgi:hypothetical protein